MQSDLITKFSWNAFCPVNYHNYKLNHKNGQNWILFQLTGDQGFCCVASISFLNTVSSLLHWSKDIIVVDVVAHVHCHLGIYTAIWEFTRVLTWHQTVRNLILFVWSIVRRNSFQRAFLWKRILELKCCLGSGIFTAAVKRGIAPHT